MVFVLSWLCLTSSLLPGAEDQVAGLGKTLRAAIKTLLDTVMDGFFSGFVPAVKRRRREVGEEERSYLDTAVTALGALVGRQNCTKVIACRSRLDSEQKLDVFDIK